MAKLERANFSSKLGVILATAGSAVGLGNVWRFPYMTGENGGAVFILIYVVCVLLLGIPCMISEFIIGRHGQANTARAFHKLSGGMPWSIIGYMGVLTGFLITGYYAVVAGWCLEYIWASFIGQMQGDPEYFKTYFAEFSGDPVKPIFWTVIILGITYLIIEHGVRDGIERASKLLMPTLEPTRALSSCSSLTLRPSTAMYSSPPSDRRSIRSPSQWAAYAPMPATSRSRPT